MKEFSLIRKLLFAFALTVCFFVQKVNAQVPANDNCTGAANLTPAAAGAACSLATAGTLNNATVSPGAPVTCTSGNLYDVWYRFTATSSNHTITINSYGTSFTRRQIVLYQGTCTGLSYVSCTAVQTTGTSLVHNNTDLSPGTVYFIRVIFPNPTGITTNGNFNICVTTASVSNAPTVQVGKSYTNISKPSGGVIQLNDELEFRSVIAVTGGTIYNTVYSDTIPAGLSYQVNSIKFSTNEGLKYESGITGMINLTDASGDDEAVVSGNIIRVNVASLRRTGGQTVYQASPATTPITTASAGGGKIRSNGRPSFYGGTSIIMVTYRVTVTALTGTVFITSNGSFRYKMASSSINDITFPQIASFLPRFSIYVSESANLCQSAVGLNNYTGGDFGSGNTRHDSTQLAIAPGYVWTPFASGAPQDGQFNVANNTSVNLSTNKYQAYNNSATRVFGWWDIIGDHTNAANPDSGNFAVPYGTTGGYMAVVNAAYGINNAVQKTINGLCTDTYYEFTSWFKNICPGCSCDTVGRGATSAQFKNYLAGPKNRDDSAGVTPDLTFQVDGVDYYTTGSIPYNKMWMKKGFLFKTGSSQSTATLTIRNNAPGGGGNDWVMDDISLGTCLPTLLLRPGYNPTYCLNAQIDLSVVVISFYSNYVYYTWERSTDGGATWISAPEMPGINTYTYTYNGSTYRDTVAIPSFLSVATKNGYKYRVKTATSIANLSNSGCSVYNNAEVFTISVNTNCDVLPVSLFQLNAHTEGQSGVLTWKANNETNLMQYEIEKSLDGVTFEKIGIITALGSLTEQQYSFVDPTLLYGKAYYRIKMVAHSYATYKYSSIHSLALNSANDFKLTNVVNPFRSTVQFQMEAPQKETVEVQLLDIAGRPVCAQKMVLQKGANLLAMEANKVVSEGTYILRIITSSGVLKQIVQKK